MSSHNNTGEASSSSGETSSSSARGTEELSFEEEFARLASQLEAMEIEEADGDDSDVEGEEFEIFMVVMQEL